MNRVATAAGSFLLLLAGIHDEADAQGTDAPLVAATPTPGPAPTATPTATPTAEQAQKIDEKNRDFLGVKFSPAFGVTSIPGRVESVEIVGNGDLRRLHVSKSSEAKVVALFEAHRLVDVRRLLYGPRSRERGMDTAGVSVNVEEVRSAIGPFLAVQSSQTNVFDAMGVGLMLGLRTGGSSAFNVGLGVMVDPNARLLSSGLVDGGAVPKDFTAAELTTTRSKWGWVLLTSFSF